MPSPGVQTDVGAQPYHKLRLLIAVKSMPYVLDSVMSIFFRDFTRFSQSNGRIDRAFSSPVSINADPYSLATAPR